MAMDPNKIIFNSMMVTLTSTVAASILPDKYGGKGELPHPRLLVGTGLSFFGLSILGDIAPAVAAPLAACVAITALTYYGVPIMDNYFVTGDNTQPVGKTNTKLVADPGVDPNN